MWRFRVTVDGQNIQDPNNAARTIVLTYNNIVKKLTANIFFRDVINVNSAIMTDATATAVYCEAPWVHKSYRRFMKLRKQLLIIYREKENIEYLKKLSSIFPTTFDEDLFK